MLWYFHLFQNFPQFIVIHTVKDFGIVNEAELDVFLEFSCFFCDPAYVGNLISSSSAFCKSSLNIWKLMVHGLLKPGFENFKHYFGEGNGNPLQYSCLENPKDRLQSTGSPGRLQSMGSQRVRHN